MHQFGDVKTNRYGQMQIFLYYAPVLQKRCMFLLLYIKLFQTHKPLGIDYSQFRS